MDDSDMKLTNTTLPSLPYHTYESITHHTYTVLLTPALVKVGRALLFPYGRKEEGSVP